MKRSLLEWCQSKGYDYPTDQETIDEAETAISFSLANDNLQGNELAQARLALEELRSIK